jgi:hypothetical protein
MVTGKRNSLIDLSTQAVMNQKADEVKSHKPPDALDSNDSNNRPASKTKSFNTSEENDHMQAIGDDISEHMSEVKHHSHSKDENEGRIFGKQEDKKAD